MDAEEQSQVGRDFGVALCREEPRAAKVALPLLESALAARADDVTAWESKGLVLGTLGKDGEAMSAFRTALDLEPAGESTLVAAAYLATKMTRAQDAVGYWRQAIAINPWRSDYRAELALIYFRDRRWNESADACRETLRLNPSWLEVRKWLVQCYLHLGNAMPPKASSR